MARETLLERDEAGVRVIALHRPERKNAFNRTMWVDLREALRDAQEDDTIRVVVVTGSGDAFTAGQDLSEMGGGSEQEEEERDSVFSRFMDRLCVFDKPLLAAVNGVAVGIGVTFLLHCDYVAIARGARLRAPFVTLGVVPEAASTYLLPTLIGYRRAADLFFESDFFDADRAAALGIADAVVEPEALMATVLAKARRLATRPLGSLRWTKRLLLATREQGVREARRREEEVFARRVGSPENREAVRAFFEKRPADFGSVPPDDALAAR